MVRPCEADLEENIKVGVQLLFIHFRGTREDRTKV